MTDSTGKGCISGHCCQELTHGDLGEVVGFHRAFSIGSFKHPFLKELRCRFANTPCHLPPLNETQEMSLADLLVGGGGIRVICLHFLKIPVVFKSSRERLSHYADWFLSPLINTQFSAVLLCCLFFGSSALSIFSAELTFGRSNLLSGTSQPTFYFLLERSPDVKKMH